MRTIGAPPATAPDIRSGVNTVTGLLFALILVRLWTAIDPQPEPLTAAVRHATDAAMDGYFLLTGAALTGLFALIRYAVSAGLHAAAVQGPKALFYLSTATMLALGCGFLTPYPGACLGIALVGAMAAKWWTEAVYRKRAQTA